MRVAGSAQSTMGWRFHTLAPHDEGPKSVDTMFEGKKDIESDYVSFRSLHSYSVPIADGDRSRAADKDKKDDLRRPDPVLDPDSDLALGCIDCYYYDGGTSFVISMTTGRKFRKFRIEGGNRFDRGGVGVGDGRKKERSDMAQGIDKHF